jgi:hypothetical protein
VPIQLGNDDQEVERAPLVSRLRDADRSREVIVDQHGRKGGLWGPGDIVSTGRKRHWKY